MAKALRASKMLNMSKAQVTLQEQTYALLMCMILMARKLRGRISKQTGFLTRATNSRGKEVEAVSKARLELVQMSKDQLLLDQLQALTPPAEDVEMEPPPDADRSPGGA
ncbi:unnamed protein product, partial [Prorocentrum cordatum]